MNTKQRLEKLEPHEKAAVEWLTKQGMAMQSGGATPEYARGEYQLIQHLLDGVRLARELHEALEKERRTPDFLAEALNSGDGTYKP